MFFVREQDAQIHVVTIAEVIPASEAWHGHKRGQNGRLVADFPDRTGKKVASRSSGSLSSIFLAAVRR